MNRMCNFLCLLMIGISTSLGYGQNFNSEGSYDSFFKNVEFKHSEYVQDESLSLFGEELILEKCVKSNYSIYREQLGETGSYFEGYLFCFEKRKIRVVSDRFLKRIKKIIILNLKNEVEGIIYFNNGEMVGLSKISYNQDNISEMFLFTSVRFLNFSKISMEYFLSPNFVEEEFSSHRKSSGNIYFERIIEEDINDYYLR